jgi:hypothetical protein
MPGLVPGIHVLKHGTNDDVDARDKRGHDEKTPSLTRSLPLSARRR